MEKVVIITGASKGIGRNMAEQLSDDGYIVIANYNKSEEEAKKLKEYNSNIHIFKADVTKREECQKLVEYAIKNYGKVDVLINNAGIAQEKLFTDITEQDWNNMINTNLNSVFYMTQETVKNMIHNKNGIIINISSIWGVVGAACEVHYSVAKAGVDAMTKSLAKELGPSNIRINSIAPGIIDTDMNKTLTLDEIKNIEKQIPLERIGKPENITACVKWLIEDKYTTGQIISINGGWAI